MKSHTDNTIRLILVLFAPLWLSTSSAKSSSLPYDDVEKGSYHEWSSTSTETSPDGRTFLGHFSGSDMANLTLDNLPSHSSVTVSFDLYLINTWDGHGDEWGPDEWEVRVHGGPILLHTTFSNQGGGTKRQAYPDWYPDGDNTARTGATEVTQFGYDTLYTQHAPVAGSVYALSFTFTHNSDLLQLDFQGFNLESNWWDYWLPWHRLMNESWGIDNVSVELDGHETYSEDFELSAGLVAYWSFDDVDDPGHDDSGNGNHGSPVGDITWTNGVRDGAVHLNGSSYINVPDSTSLDLPNGSGTISAFIKIDPSSDEFGIVSKESSSSYPWTIAYEFNVRHSGTYETFLISDGTTTSWAKDENVASLKDSKWHHVAATWSGSGGEIIIYRDGIQIVQSSQTISTINNISEPVRIGAFRWNVGGTLRYMTGDIDEVRIYDRALSPCEIKELATACELPCVPSFQGLGDLSGGNFYSQATGVSADGLVVIGYSASSSTQKQAFRWTLSEGMQPLGDLPGGGSESMALGVSADGSTIVGRGQSSTSAEEAFRWTQGTGMVGLGQMSGHPHSVAVGVSTDGSKAVGYGQTMGIGWGTQAFLWTLTNPGTGEGIMEVLEDLSGDGIYSAGYAISYDGSTIVGHQGNRGVGGNGLEACYWRKDSGGQYRVHGLGVPGVSHAVTHDGSVIVGGFSGPSGLEVFRWTEATGIVGLGDLDGGSFHSYADDITADGSVIVGLSNSTYGDEAFIWDESHGMRSLKEVLVGNGLDLTGWTLRRAYGISDDGLTIVGWGINPDGNTEAWIARLCKPAKPEPNIQVSPTTYDFGDVEIGSSETMFFSIGNVGEVSLTVDNISFQSGSSSDFSITSGPALPATVASGGSIDVGITFVPSMEYYSTAVLEIGSNDPDDSLVEVALGGVGVGNEIPPSEQVGQILDFIYVSVDNGTLVGNGPGKSGEGRLKALINMIEAAGDLIRDGLFDQAYEQLQDAYNRTDSQSPPPDFVTGEAVSELAVRIKCLMQIIRGTIIVTVDGISPESTLLGLIGMPWPWDDIENYLGTALTATDLQAYNVEIVNFKWSRNPGLPPSGDTYWEVRNLRDLLREQCHIAKTEDKKFIVVSHSWGTFLSYCALSDLSQDEEPVHCDLYITLSSPLGTYAAHEDMYPQEGIINAFVTNWTAALAVDPFGDWIGYPLTDKHVNFWAWGDVISGPLNPLLSGVIDKNVDYDSIEGGNDERNFTTTLTDGQEEGWHKFTSLSVGGTMDNQSLRDTVENLIIQTLSE